MHSLLSWIRVALAVLSLGLHAGPPPTATPAGEETERGGVPAHVIVLFGVGGMVLVATVIVTLAVILKNPVIIQVPRSPAPPEDDSARSRNGVSDTGGRAAQATLKILPGRFVVEEGEGSMELRIFRTEGGDRVETTIGRDQGSPYRHIQLRAPSVSAKHAKLVFDNGTYSLINYSRTNPTRVNGEVLPEGDARRLANEDRIDIGEVAMTYYES